jgi:hypothetical protein
MTPNTNTVQYNPVKKKKFMMSEKCTFACNIIKDRTLAPPEE